MITGIVIGATIAAAAFIITGQGIFRGTDAAVSGRPPELAQLHQSTPTASPTQADVEEEIGTSRRTAIVRAVQRVAPAVVTITVTQLRRERYVNPLFERHPLYRHFFPDMGREFIRRVESMGSGVIVSDEGLVMTNAHVVQGAAQIVVNLPDGRSFEAEPVGEPDMQSDIAVVRIEGEDLPHAPLGQSDDVMIGEWAIAIGNPYGYLIRDVHPTVTVGVVSAVNRDFDATLSRDRVYRDMIQTDASINPGNSGGPLVNSQGYVIGINTFIFSQSRGSEGIGFAIPISRARQVMEDILRYGEARHNFWTGIHIQDMNQWIAQSLGLQNTNGAIITELDDDSPGEKAGLRRGDVIVAVNGRGVSRTSDVRREFRGAVVEQEMELTIVRDGQRMEITIVLEEEPMNGRESG